MNDPFVTNVTLVSTLCICLLSAILIAGFIGIVFFWYPRYRNKNIARLKETGRQGEATILWFPGPGQANPSRPAIFRRVKTKLEIRVPGLAPYEIDKEFTIPSHAVSRLEIGKVVPVWVDPEQPLNRAKIVIEII